jgi:hypothetical protein
MDTVKADLEELIVRAREQKENTTQKLSGYDDWEELVTIQLRKLPNAKELVLGFVRLQKHHNYSWIPDMGEDEKLAEVVSKALDDSIAFVENVIKKL